MNMAEEVFLQATAKVLDETIEAAFGEKMGFALLIFPFGDGEKQGNYISNAKRKDMIQALRETADRIEKNDIIPPSFGSA